MLLGAFTLALGLAALLNVASMSETSRLLSVESLPGLYLTGRLNTEQARLQVLILTHIASSDAEHMAAEEMSSMTQRNAENSKESAKLVALVDQNVGAANETLNEMVASMHDIGASSNKISKIIKVIDEIAFQTNILALNAAVEAARAGEAGAGFAVVADEVRNLAQRSAQAAKDTALLIEESIARSGEGSAKLDRVAVSIRSITESATKVRTLVEEVSPSSQEQASGVDQIAKSIVEMQTVTQRAAAQAEESAAAGEELLSQSEAMKDSVRQLGSLVVAS